MRLLLIVLSLFSLSACTKVAFRVDDKINAMKANVLGDGGSDTDFDDGDDSDDESRTPRTPRYPLPRPTATPKYGVPTPTPTATPKLLATPTPKPTSTPLPTPGVTNVPVDRHCSDRQSAEVGTNVATATTVSIQIFNSSNALACAIPYSPQLRDALNNGYLPTASCSLGDGVYTVRATADGRNVMRDDSIREFHIEFGNVVYSTVTILMDSNPNQTDVDLPYHGIQCDSSASPLFVDFRKDATDYDILSSQKDGVMFDILGANGGYKKSQISWFGKGHFGLLALPNAKGQVENIDQLFGDNTMGPDKKFAENGFLALAKHDSNGDKVIDQYDKVFSKLRLWFDLNRDGKADRNELKTLDEMRLVAIDLDYDHNFYEKDKYGNEIKFKSVVKFKSGRLRSIFDVWFKLNYL